MLSSVHKHKPPTVWKKEKVIGGKAKIWNAK